MTKQERLQKLTELAGTMPAAEVAKAMGITRAALRSLAYRGMISLAFEKKRWTEQEIKIIRKNARKLTAKQIAKLLDGRSEDAVTHYANNNGISMVKRGQYHHCSTVTDEDVALCRALFDDGMSVKLIAQKMELPHRYVSLVVYNLARL